LTLLLRDNVAIWVKEENVAFLITLIKGGGRGEKDYIVHKTLTKRARELCTTDDVARSVL